VRNLEGEPRRCQIKRVASFSPRISRGGKEADCVAEAQGAFDNGYCRAATRRRWD
jgi:hypothetical protein